MLSPSLQLQRGKGGKGGKGKKETWKLNNTLDSASGISGICYHTTDNSPCENLIGDVGPQTAPIWDPGAAPMAALPPPPFSSAGDATNAALLGSSSHPILRPMAPSNHDAQNPPCIPGPRPAPKPPNSVFYEMGLKIPAHGCTCLPHLSQIQIFCQVG